MKKMVKNKRGQALSLNTVVIAVIVVVVLIVVVSFFLFGFQGLTDRVKSIFFGTTAGTDRVLAIQQCQNFCGQLDILPDNVIAIRESPYCSFSFLIDGNNDGKADVDTATGELIKYYCSNSAEGTSLGVNCPKAAGIC